MAREQSGIPTTYDGFRYDVLRIDREDDEYRLSSNIVHKLREAMKTLIQRVDNIDKNLLLYREDSKEFRREIREENEKFRAELLGRFESIHQRFEKIDERFERIDQNFIDVFKALNRQIYWMVGSIFDAGGLISGFMKV